MKKLKNEWDRNQSSMKTTGHRIAHMLGSLCSKQKTPSSNPGTTKNMNGIPELEPEG
jgi:hypothetical protein